MKRILTTVFALGFIGFMAMGCSEESFTPSTGGGGEGDDDPVIYDPPANNGGGATSGSTSYNIFEDKMIELSSFETA